MDYQALAEKIKQWGNDLGFQQVGISDVDLSQHEEALRKWLESGYHGEMEWMSRHGTMRSRPDELLPGTVRVISARIDYLPPEARFASDLSNKRHAYISRYSLGRDYHKLVRNKLNKLGKMIEEEVSTLGYRPFVDSAPILERPLAEKAGLGWVGKHSLLLNKEAGSWFFIGELLIDIPLPVDEKAANECGKCTACVRSCPTGAIVEEGVVDSRRCISYLTIEYDGVIPVEFRRAMGNRIYGCDDCQLVCPWNRFANLSTEKDFYRREHFQSPDLITLFNWTEQEFLKQMEGSAIRRIGYIQWLRNLSVALGNSPYSQEVIFSLESKKGLSEVLDQHIDWAIREQLQQISSLDSIEETPDNDRKLNRLIRVVQKGLSRDA